MSKLYINGGKRLFGELTVHGAKNSVLPILAATILCGDECVIHNCPYLSDVDSSIKILEHLGCRCHREGHTLIVDTSNITRCDIPDELMQEMRSSIVWLGAIAGRLGKARLSSPGGCELGPRPIDIHLAALRELGLRIDEDHGYIDCRVIKRLRGNSLHLTFPSVGATENIMLAAVFAQGKTVIHNAAKEPEIIDLQNFLNRAGARVSGAGSDTVVIEGVASLHGAEHSVISDRIVTATYMAAAAVTGGEVVLKKTVPGHLLSVISVFREMGCMVETSGNDIKLISPSELCRFINVQTLVYPGFPTDAGPLVVAAASVANGTSMFVENIFESRYKYIGELRRLGAKIKTANRVAVIDGVSELSGAKVKSTDLRGGAALVIAGLAANGRTEIDRVSHIDRGYEDIEENLRCLGADIKRK
ncbi:MAG: UDP-N-acetylglucosamine 1-carboxyvinyltransferase [Ruminococcaceae bacterium]|nr:UDP-N-acetylglucosamine 1-carboxyvinyltransferase [Oscillospiraceae bacterium]